jgi:hypothetical protein
MSRWIAKYAAISFICGVSAASGWALAAATTGSLTGTLETDRDDEIVRQLLDVKTSLKDIRGDLKGIRDDLASMHSTIDSLPRIGAVVAFPIRGDQGVSGPDFCQSMEGTFLRLLPMSQAISSAVVVCRFP